jgi:hypothetical protein
MMWGQLAYVTTTDFIFYGQPQASYFSLFGIYLGTLTYTLLLISHCRHPRRQNPEDDSIFVLWKWCLFCMVLFFHWQFINTMTYWLVINWEIEQSLKLQPEAV